jgi:hypothetical protein
MTYVPHRGQGYIGSCYLPVMMSVFAKGQKHLSGIARTYHGKFAPNRDPTVGARDGDVEGFGVQNVLHGFIVSRHVV